MSEYASPQLVAQVKDMQRNDPRAKEQWWNYCDTQGGGIRDPAKHVADFINGFIQTFDTSLVSVPDGNLSQLVKEGQRKSKHWKSAWASYCNTFGAGKNDPSKHDQTYIVGFLDFVGQQAEMALAPLAPLAPSGMGSFGQSPGYAGGLMAGFGNVGQPAKREFGKVHTSTGDFKKDALVKHIKDFQRMGDSQKEAWWSFCETLGGIRDPARHESDVLQSFIVSAGNMGLSVGLDENSYPPAKRPRILLGQNGGKDALVTRIKAFQRMGSSQKEAWWQFCDTNMNGIRDPARHEIDTLEGFIGSVGVP